MLIEQLGDKGVELESLNDIGELEDVFKRYHPPLHRAILGDLLTLRFITRFIKQVDNT